MRGLARRSLTRLALKSEKGQGMLEYALIIMLVALVVFGALAIIGPKVAGIYNTAANSLGS
jgi:pilus assembly protein Flp/PilA